MKKIVCSKYRFLYINNIIINYLNINKNVI